MAPTDRRGGAPRVPSGPRRRHRAVLLVTGVLVAALWSGAAVAGAQAVDEAQPPATTVDPGVDEPTTDPEGDPDPTSGTTATTAPSTTEPSPGEDDPGADDGTEEPTTTTPGATEAEAEEPAVPASTPEGFTDEQFRRFVDVVETCGADPGWFCNQVDDLTGNRVLAQSAQWLIDIPLRILLILAVAFVANRLVRRAISRWLDRLVTRARASATADPDKVQRTALRMATASTTLASAATVAIFAVAALVALSELSINLGPMLAGAGIAGIAIGFGAQNLVRDVLAGLFVIIEDQYGVGDVIDAGRAVGVVEEFNLRVTRVRDLDGTLWFVPNGVISEVGNKSQLWARAILDIEVAYQSDHNRAGELIKGAADRVWRRPRPGARILEEPELWGVERLGESGVTIRLAAKCAPAEQWTVARVLRAEIKDALDAAGIEIPFPQRTVWVRGAEGGGLPGPHDGADHPASSAG